MKIIISVLFFLLLTVIVHSQSPEGIWYSEDSTRTYRIFQQNNSYNGILVSSKRKGEKKGVLIIDKLVQTKNKKTYRGIMYSAMDGSPVACTATFTDGGNVLKLKLRRMLFLPVTIYWHRLF